MLNGFVNTFAHAALSLQPGPHVPVLDVDRGWRYGAPPSNHEVTRTAQGAPP